MADMKTSTTMAADQSAREGIDAEVANLSGDQILSATKVKGKEHNLEEDGDTANVPVVNAMKKPKDNHRVMWEDESDDENPPLLPNPDNVLRQWKQFGLYYYYTENDLLPIEECFAFRERYSEGIFELHFELGAVLDSSEALVRELWWKKSVEEQKAVLLRAWPNMIARHRVDQAGLPQDNYGTIEQLLQAVMFPYMNLETLLLPNVLLIFLNHRGRYLPDAFARSELRSASAYRFPKEVLDLRKDNYTMTFLGRESAEEYGTFVAWESADAKARAIDTGRFVHVDHGLQILHTQFRVLQFLCTCVLHILGGRAVAPIIQPEPPQLQVVYDDDDDSGSMQKKSFRHKMRQTFLSPQSYQHAYTRGLKRLRGTWKDSKKILTSVSAKL